MKKLLVGAAALPLVLATCQTNVAYAQATGSSVQFPAGYAPSTSVCVKQGDGTCIPVDATHPLPISGGTGGGAGGDPSSTGTPGSAAPNTVSVIGGYDGAAVRRILTDTNGRQLTTIATPLPAGTNAIGSITNTAFNAGAQVVTGDQSYTIGTTQLINMTPSGRTKVALSSSGNVDPAAQQTTTTESLLVACKNRASSTFAAGYTGALGCDTAGNLNVNNATLPPGASTAAKQDAMTAALGSPFQAGGSIGNTAFGISGTLPAFATTPTFNIGTGGAGVTATPLRTDPTGTTTQPVSGTVTANLGTLNGAATATNQASQLTAEQGTQTSAATLAGTIGTRGSTAPSSAQTVQGVDASGNGRGLCANTAGVLCAPVAGIANSNGTVTSLAATTSTTVCPATTNPVVFEVQIYGSAPVLLGLDGQALTAVTPAAGSGAYITLPTQYSLYVGSVARTNAITAYTGTAQMIVCNIVTRQ